MGKKLSTFIGDSTYTRAPPNYRSPLRSNNLNRYSRDPIKVKMFNYYNHSCTSFCCSNNSAFFSSFNLWTIKCYELQRKLVIQLSLHLFLLLPFLPWSAYSSGFLFLVTWCFEAIWDSSILLFTVAHFWIDSMLEWQCLLPFYSSLTLLIQFYLAFDACILHHLLVCHQYLQCTACALAHGLVSSAFWVWNSSVPKPKVYVSL